MKKWFKCASKCACEIFPICGTETFFNPKEKLAILIYNTNYDVGPKW